MGVEFRDTKFAALLERSEISAGWHSRNLILGNILTR